MSNLFGSPGFKSLVEKYCKQQDWKIAEIDDKHATIRFNMESGRVQTLYIIKYDNTLEFSVPSLAAFDSEDKIPHFLSTILLKKSATQKVGFWTIEEIGGKHVYSVMQNVEMQLLEAEYFTKVVRALVSQCDDFEGLLLKMLEDNK
ncbi:MAG TPA: hypothetical protein PLA25_05305 [Anaerolineaceae bacterium]|nr:hypothetical protein [Anaerolineaceae bacterium]